MVSLIGLRDGTAVFLFFYLKNPIGAYPVYAPIKFKV
jgi:hypothetical protein